MNSFFDVCDEVGIQMADTFSRILGFKRNLHIGSVPVTVIAPKSKSFSLGKAALLKAELTILMQKAEDGDWGASEETEYIHLQAQLNDCYMWNAVISVGIPLLTICAFHWYAPDQLKRGAIRYRPLSALVGGIFLFIFFVPLVPFMSSLLMTTSFSLLWQKYLNDLRDGKLVPPKTLSTEGITNGSR